MSHPQLKASLYKCNHYSTDKKNSVHITQFFRKISLIFVKLRISDREISSLFYVKSKGTIAIVIVTVIVTVTAIVTAVVK